MRVRLEREAVPTLRRLQRATAIFTLVPFAFAATNLGAPYLVAFPVYSDRILSGLMPGTSTETTAHGPSRLAPPRPEFYPARNPFAAELTPASFHVATPAPATAPSEPARPVERASALALMGIRVSRIVIDAGHGGYDEGTVGPDGVAEKDVVLDVALRLSGLIQRHSRTEVLLTRFDDSYVSLPERISLANDRGADLFLSIHANSSPLAEVAGTETYFVDFDAETHPNERIATSRTIAQTVQSSIFGKAASSNAESQNRGVKRAPFMVLTHAAMPSILAEIGFLSNAHDESNLSRPEYRQSLAEALYDGLWRMLAGSQAMPVAKRQPAAHRAHKSHPAKVPA